MDDCKKIFTRLLLAAFLSAAILAPARAQLTDGLPGGSTNGTGGLTLPDAPPPALGGGDTGGDTTPTGSNGLTTSGNTSTAPEPATLVSALAGAGLTALVAWRRRRGAAAA